MKKEILNYYLRFSQFTNPGLYKNILRNLPDKIEGLGLLVREQFIHRSELDKDAGISNETAVFNNIKEVPWFRQCEDDNFPTVAAMLAELYRRNESGFLANRAPQDKLVVTCRFVTILMASILKSKKIPARVRSGFAPYFERFNNKSAVHWINQYWDNKKQRWVTIDIDACLNKMYFNPFDMPEEAFDFPADVWLDIRSGKDDGARFCHWNITNISAPELVIWKLFHDFHSLMNNEIIYQHVPKKFERKNFKQLAEDDLIKIDALACLMQNPDENFDKLETIWETDKDFRILTGAELDPV